MASGSRLEGHGWTLWGYLRDIANSPSAPAAQPWTGRVDDQALGEIRLTGLVSHRPESDRMLVVLHGMGADAGRSYCVRAAAAAAAHNMACLRLNLRGADGSGEDIYHIGLTDDLRAALASEDVRRYPKVYVLGFSLGGHIAVRHAADGSVGVRATVAVCAPLDLEAGVLHMDRRRSWVYRQHVLHGVKVVHRRAVDRGRLPDLDTKDIRTIREWDERVVAPRFGFSGATDYYRRAGVTEIMHQIHSPLLFATAPSDPMIPRRSVEQVLAKANPAVEVRTLAGGHVGFPSEDQVVEDLVGWLVQH